VNEVKPVKVQIVRYKNREDRNRVRVAMARKVLCELIGAARSQVGPQRWINEGGLELEEFLYDLDTGHAGQWLKEWQQTPLKGRPPASPREQQAQWYLCLAVVALERVFSLGPGEAREEVAKKAARMFEQPVTAKKIEHWQDMQPLLSSAVEVWLAKTISASRTDEPGGRDRLLNNFIGAAHSIITPLVQLVDDE
jgi:hypothetical protein